MFIGMMILAGALDRTKAQDTGTISGRVLEAPSDQPIEDVNVVIVGSIFGGVTDAEGHFTIDQVPPDTYTLQVSTLGYRTARQSVAVEAGATVEVTFRLTPVQEQDATPAQTASYPRVQVEERQIRRIDAPDPGMILRALPGVGAVRRGPLGLDPNVRGLVASEVGVYINGQRSFPGGPLRMDSPLSHVDPSAIEHVEVVKGPYALTEGLSMSGVRVETRGAEVGAGTGGYLQSGFRGNGQAVETAGALTGSLFGAAYRVHGAYRTGEDYEAGNDESVPAQYKSGAVRGRIVYPVGPSSKLIIDGDYQDQRDISYPGLPLDAEFFEAGTGAVRYQFSRERGLLRGLSVQVYGAQILHGMNNDEKPSVEIPSVPLNIDVDVQAELQNIGGRVATQLVPRGRWRVKLGSDVYHTYHSATRTVQGSGLPDSGTPPTGISDQVWPGVTLTDIGFYTNGERAFGPLTVSATARLDLTWADADRISPAFLMDVGVTRDDIDASGAHLSGALGLTIPLSPQWTFTLTGGTAVRTADALERYSSRFPSSRAPLSAEVQGNPALKPERSFQGDLELKGSYERFNLELNAFARHMNDYIMLTPTPLNRVLPTSPDVVFRYVNGEATFWGAEVAGRYVLNPLITLSGQGNYLWGKNEQINEPALGIEPLSAALGIRLEAPFNQDIFLESTLHLVAEQNRVATARGEIPTDGYTTADLRLGFTPTSRATLTLGIENLTDAAYADPLNARRPFIAQPVLEPGRTFSANLRVSF